MTSRTGHTLALVAMVALVATLHCGPATPRDELEPVELPDLSAVEAHLAERLRERHAELEAAFAGDSRTLVAAYGNLGVLAHACGLSALAAGCYRNGERLAPDDPRWSYYLAHLRREAGAFSEAIARFERTLELEPNDRVALIHLGELYLDGGRPDAAEALFARAIRAGGDTAPAEYGLGQIAAARGDWAAAREHFENALRLVPGAGRIHYQLALTHERLGNDELAQEHMAQQGPGIPRPYDERMEQVRSLKERLRAAAAPGGGLAERDEQEVVAELRAAVEAQPDDPVAHLRLGTLLARRGALDEARAHYEHVLRYATDRRMTSNAHLNLGNLELARRRWAEAAGEFEQVLAIDAGSPEASPARIGLARALLGLGRPDDAEPHWRAALAADSVEAEAYVALAQGLSQAGRHAAARDVLEQGRAAYPRDAAVANELARLLATCPDDAVRDGTTALNLAVGLFEARKSGPHAVTLAMALAETGQFDEAIELQRAAIEGAESVNDRATAESLRRHLALYESRRPVRLP